ncbi:MAG TPA: hypothetical protein VNK49_05565 [Anaerolineales bacterium]|nr:hypothetical protein [Anaerolineales bacterium]
MLKNPLTPWLEIQAEENRLLRALTPQEGLRQFFALLAEFGPRLQETESLYRRERIQAMIALQARLGALNRKSPHGTSG